MYIIQVQQSLTSTPLTLAKNGKYNGGNVYGTEAWCTKVYKTLNNALKKMDEITKRKPSLAVVQVVQLKEDTATVVWSVTNGRGV